MVIENFKLIEYLNQPIEIVEKYTVALRYLKPIETEVKVFNMKLKHVEMIKQTLNSGSNKDLITIVSKVQKITEEEVLDIPIIKFFGIMASIREQLEMILKAEKNGLTPSRINVKWQAVNGSERMAKFGIYNSLDLLTGKKPHLYKKYMNMVFSELFLILLKWKEEADLQFEMDQIKTK